MDGEEKLLELLKSIQNKDLNHSHFLSVEEQVELQKQIKRLEEHIAYVYRDFGSDFDDYEKD